MQSTNSYFLATLIIMSIAVFIYWTMPTRRRIVIERPVALGALVVATLSGFFLCYVSLSGERTAYTYHRQENPFAIAIAFDLSPSMLAIPHPSFQEDVAPRYVRGKGVIRDFLRRLDDNGELAYVSIIGFTRQADILMGWDDNPAQVRDIIEYAVAPELLGSSGTSFEAAAKSLDDVFRLLPEHLQANGRKLIIIVSDGEDTMRSSSFAYAEEALALTNTDIIAVQAGLLDHSEGIPILGEYGEFTDFQAIRGTTYTVPDVAAMTSLANASVGRGLYVRAESTDVVQNMLNFATKSRRQTNGADVTLLSTFGMFTVLASLCAAIIR
ncbi:MAG: VWA domain-containing protein [Woeseiaceae bacterium]|nr:VWA domain-containing protein [Woeseiaceae bacterium]